MHRFTLLMAAIPLMLSGCLQEDKGRQLAKCQLEAEHFKDDWDRLSHVTLCMKAAGYDFYTYDRPCFGYEYAFKMEECYRSDSYFGKFLR